MSCSKFPLTGRERRGGERDSMKRVILACVHPVFKNSVWAILSTDKINRKWSSPLQFYFPESATNGFSKVAELMSLKFITGCCSQIMKILCLSSSMSSCQAVISSCISFIVFIRKLCNLKLSEMWANLSLRDKIFSIYLNNYFFILNFAFAHTSPNQCHISSSGFLY